MLKGMFHAAICSPNGQLFPVMTELFFDKGNCHWESGTQRHLDA